MTGMGSYQGAPSQHRQLTAGVVDTVTLDAPYPEVEIIGRDGAAEMFATVNGPDPVAGGAGTILIPAAITGVVVNGDTSSEAGNTVIKLVSGGTPKYSVRGLE